MESSSLKIRRWVATVVVVAAFAGGALLSQGFREWAGHAVFGASREPITIAQNARTSGGGNVTMVPTKAISVGPVETWQAEKVSIWQAGNHDNPFGQRLTTLMIAKRIPDSAVPMSLLADHPNVQFNFYRNGIGVCEVDMH